MRASASASCKNFTSRPGSRSSMLMEKFHDHQAGHQMEIFGQIHDADAAAAQTRLNPVTILERRPDAWVTCCPVDRRRVRCFS